MNQIEDEHSSKRQKTIHECKLCYVEPCTTTLKCGHEMCAECCIKHFRKTINCPFCRAIICEKEDRTDEYKQIISEELHNKYGLPENDIQYMSMYRFLKFKGINKSISREIIDTIKDRCLEMFKVSEEYNEILSTIKEEWEESWNSTEDESEDDSEFISEEK